ncbi:MAG: gamma-glutamyltransferase [Anaerolineae bacterium]|nr:gamma-glutamyltransferase [Anaerolineae bacterium]
MNFEQFDFPSRRSNVMSFQGLVATSQPLAAQAGLDVLKAGGNAVDAAIATVATLCVVEPCSTGIGGDAFALIWSAQDQKLYGLNASGPAPEGLTAVLLQNRGYTTMPTLGALSVTVPGSLRGWEAALTRFGSMGLDSLLARPIGYAQDGFPVSQRIARAWHNSTDKLSGHEDSRRVWLQNGRSPQAGARFRNPEFAATLKTIAEQGSAPFYQGAIGQQIVDSVQAAGGVLSLADLGNYQAEWVEPLRLDYKNGFSFYEIPPNGQGLTALIALNMVKQLEITSLEYGSADYYHILMEIMKLAFADAHAYIGDPRMSAIPASGLLSDGYAQKRFAQINMQQAQPPQAGNPSRHGDTVYLTVADSAGNMVSWIQSLYMGFGSGLTAGKTGVQLQNRGANFTMAEGHPNQVAPGKRPYHTIIPGFITKDGQAWSSFGVMGGFMQPQGHLQVGLNLVDFEMDPQSALDAPRFNWLQGMEFGLETAVSAQIRTELKKRGHLLHPTDQPLQYGGGQVIVRDPETGDLIGGSEPRNDGTAVGW